LSVEEGELKVVDLRRRDFFAEFGRERFGDGVHENGCDERKESAVESMNAGKED
jgi:hypothetical protein